MVLIAGKTYDVLKFLALVVLPALASVYFALAGIWELPLEVVGAIVVVDTLLGVVLQLSSRVYAKSDTRFDGTINVLDAEDGVQNFSMSLPVSAEDVLEKDALVFKVNHR